MASTVLAGKAVVEAGVKDNTKKGIDAIKKRFRTMSASMAKMSKKTAIAAAAIGGPLIAAAKAFANTGDKIDKLTQRTGLSVKAAQSFGFAMEQSGSSMEALEPAIKALNKGFLDFQRGSKEAKDNFKELGIDFQKFAGMDAANRFRMVLDLLGEIPNEGMRAALAAKVLGKSGTAVLPLIGNLKSLEREFSFLGTELSEEQVKSAAKVTDEFNKLSHQFKKVAVDIGSKVAPMLIQLAKFFEPILKLLSSVIKKNPGLIISLGKVAGAIGGVSLALKLLSMALVTNPFTLIVTAIGLGLTALIAFNETLKGTNDLFKDTQILALKAAAKEKAEKMWAGKDPGRQRSPEEIAKDQAAALKMLGGKGAGAFDFKATTKKEEKKEDNILKGFGNVFRSGSQMLGNAIANGSTFAAHAITGVGKMAEAANIPMISSTAGAMGNQALGLRGAGAATSAEQMLSLQKSSSAHLAAINVNIQGMRNEGINTKDE